MIECITTTAKTVKAVTITATPFEALLIHRALRMLAESDADESDRRLAEKMLTEWKERRSHDEG